MLYLLNKKGIAGLARTSLQPPSWAYETPALPLQTHIMRWNGTPVADDRGGIDVSIVDLEKGK